MTLRQRLLSSVCFAPEGPAGGSAGGAAGASDPGAPSPGGGAGPSAPPNGQPAGGNQAGQQLPPAQAYRPDGLPEHLFGANDRETIDKLYKAVNGFRSSQGERGAVPDSADKYQLTVDEALKPYLADFDKDPVFKGTRDIFHKAGVTDRQFDQIVGPWLKMLVDGGLVDKPVDAQAQLLSLAPASASNLDEAGRKAAASRRVSDNVAWVDGAKSQGTLPAEQADFLAATLASDPRAHGLVEWLRGQAAEPRPAMNGANAGGGVTEDQIKARITDPRNDPMKPQFDRAFAAETDRLSQAQWGQTRPGR